MYDPSVSYEQNFAHGPFPEWCFPQRSFPRLRYLGKPRYDFLGKLVHVPLGVPAGPLLNSRFVQVAWDAGLSVCTYKTVRSQVWPSHAHPNVLSVRPSDSMVGQLSQYGTAVDESVSSPTSQAAGAVSSCSGAEMIPRVCASPLTSVSAADAVASAQATGALPLSITNSFGVPSQDPTWWQADVASLLTQSGAYGRELVVSFQGSREKDASSGPAGFEAFVRDAQHAQALAIATGASLLEVNLSCPNESGTPIYRDRQGSIQLLRALAETRPPGVRLIAKIGSLAHKSGSPECLGFVESCGPYVDGFSAINTVLCEISGSDGSPALGSGSSFGGVCGALIFQENLRMTRLLVAARESLGVRAADLFIVSVGGVNSVERFQMLRDAGADHVQAATACMWNLDLPRQIADSLRVSYEAIGDAGQAQFMST
jgi:dihydroorotate dehydrogenase (NAD+) catalytic subunit